MTLPLVGDYYSSLAQFESTILSNQNNERALPNKLKTTTAGRSAFIISCTGGKKKCRFQIIVKRKNYYQSNHHSDNSDDSEDEGERDDDRWGRFEVTKAICEHDHPSIEVITPKKRGRPTSASLKSTVEGEDDDDDEEEGHKELFEGVPIFSLKKRSRCQNRPERTLEEVEEWIDWGGEGIFKNGEEVRIPLLEKGSILERAIEKTSFISEEPTSSPLSSPPPSPVITHSTINTATTTTNKKNKAKTGRARSNSISTFSNHNYPQPIRTSDRLLLTHSRSQSNSSTYSANTTSADKSPALNNSTPFFNRSQTTPSTDVEEDHQVMVKQTVRFKFTDGLGILITSPTFELSNPINQFNSQKNGANFSSRNGMTGKKGPVSALIPFS